MRELFKECFDFHCNESVRRVNISCYVTMFHIYYNSLGGSGQISPATIAMTVEKVKSVHTWQAAKKPLRPLYGAFRKVLSKRQLYVSESKNCKKIFDESSSNLKPKSTTKVGCLVTISNYNWQVENLARRLMAIHPC